VYLAGLNPVFDSTGNRHDTYTVNTRIIGGPATQPANVNPERRVYSMITGVINQLTYSRYLEDPSSGLPFRYIDPQLKVQVAPIGHIQTFDYGSLGKFIGIDIPSNVMLTIHVGRQS
jgi:hypothetical protein